VCTDRLRPRRLARYMAPSATRRTSSTNWAGAGPQMPTEIVTGGRSLVAEMLPTVGDQSIAEHGGVLVGVHAPGHHEELVPADAGDLVFGTHGGSKGLPDGTEVLIAHTLPETIVDPLEGIDIAERQYDVVTLDGHVFEQEFEAQRMWPDGLRRRSPSGKNSAIRRARAVATARPGRIQCQSSLTRSSLWTRVAKTTSTPGYRPNSSRQVSTAVPSVSSSAAPRTRDHRPPRS